MLPAFKKPSARWMLPGLLFTLLTLLIGCTGSEATEPAPAGATTPAALTITSAAFEPGQPIPMRYTCQGDNISPPLEWSALPPGTQSLALIMDDPDAPMGTWVHWVVFNLPPDTTGLAEGAGSGQTALPAGAVEGSTSGRGSGYGGPCPPSGTHRYFFHLYALDTTLPEQPIDKSGLLQAIDGHILGQGEFFGTYQKE